MLLTKSEKIEEKYLFELIFDPVVVGVFLLVTGELNLFHKGSFRLPIVPLAPRFGVFKTANS